jgi:drug/metabolite transporter (DMT)-like permease
MLERICRVYIPIQTLEYTKQMTWYMILILGSVLSAVAFTIQRKHLSDNLDFDPIAYSIGLYIYGAVLLVMIASAMGGYTLPDLAPVWGYVAINVIGGAIATVALYAGLQRLEASHYSIIDSSRPLWTVIIAGLFLGILPHVAQIVGGTLLVVAIIFVNSTKKGMYDSRGVQMAVVSAFLFGCTVVSDKLIFKQVAVLSFAPVGMLLNATLLLMWKPDAVKGLRLLLDRRHAVRFFVPATFLIVAVLLHSLGTQAAPTAAVASMLFLTHTVLIIIFGTIFLGERDYLVRKIISAVVALVGVILIVA